MLSAHLDSWDAGSGATDNGTGTITMLEAMRILKTVYPHPKRTILVGHWSGEEQGEHRLGRVRRRSSGGAQRAAGAVQSGQRHGRDRFASQTNGFVDAAPALARWMSRMPADITRGVS